MTTFYFNLPKKYIDSALVITPKKEIRYYLNGVYIELFNNEGRIVSTDGHRLFAAKFNTELNLTNNIDFIIPREYVERILKVKSKTEEISVAVEFNAENHIKIKLALDGTIIECRPIDGKFPDYRRVFPEKTSGETGNFNGEYLADFDKICQKITGNKNAIALISHNGLSAALVDFQDENCIAVICPLRETTLTSIIKPLWVSNNQKLKEAA